MARTSVVSSRLSEDQEERLVRRAKQLGRTPSETSALLIEEGLRRGEFAFIDFRDSPIGRLAYIQGSTLAVWEVITLVREYGGDVQAAATHLSWSPLRVQAAVNYEKAFPAEIEEAIQANERNDLDAIARLLPQAMLPKRPPSRRRRKA